eukprot:6193921-Amphidinium_carterae.2
MLRKRGFAVFYLNRFINEPNLTLRRRRTSPPRGLLAFRLGLGLAGHRLWQWLARRKAPSMSGIRTETPVERGPPEEHVQEPEQSASQNQQALK